jgi:hypothetical protein
VTSLEITLCQAQRAKPVSVTSFSPRQVFVNQSLPKDSSVRQHPCTLLSVRTSESVGELDYQGSGIERWCRERGSNPQDLAVGGF